MNFKLRYSIRRLLDTYITFELMAPLPTETRHDSVFVELLVIWEHKNNSLAMKGIRVTLQGPWHSPTQTWSAIPDSRLQFFVGLSFKLLGLLFFAFAFDLLIPHCPFILLGLLRLLRNLHTQASCYEPARRGRRLLRPPALAIRVGGSGRIGR